MNKTTSTSKLHNNDLHVENCYYCIIENKNNTVDFSAQNLVIEEKRQLDLTNRKTKRAEQKPNESK